MASGNTAGELNVIFKGDASSAKAAAEQARDAFRKTADEAKTSAGSVDSAFKTVNKSLGESIQTITGLIGKFTAVIGVAGTFYSIGQQINEMLKSGTKRAEEFLDSFDNTRGKESLKELQVEIKKVEKELGEALSKSSTSWRDGSDAYIVKDAQARLNLLRASEKSLLEQQSALDKRKAEADDASQNEQNRLNQVVYMQEVTAEAEKQAQLIQEANDALLERMQIGNFQDSELRAAQDKQEQEEIIRNHKEYMDEITAEARLQTEEAKKQFDFKREQYDLEKMITEMKQRQSQGAGFGDVTFGATAFQQQIPGSFSISARLSDY